MQPIMIQRGFNDTFYFVETEKAQASAAIYQLKGKDKQKIHEVSNGKVVALELDAGYMVEKQDRLINSVGEY